MKQVRGASETIMARPRYAGFAVPACDIAPSRRAFAARAWHGSPLATMPSLGKGHGTGHTAILANGTRRLKEPST